MGDQCVTVRNPIRTASANRPISFTIFFLWFPSGLVLYWLTNNVVSILQQEVTLHLIGERKLGGGKNQGRRKK